MKSNREQTETDRSLLEKFSTAAQNLPSPQNIQNIQDASSETVDSAQHSAQSAPAASPIAQRICFIHTESEGLYYCSNCNAWRCKECAHVYNGVAVCPDCDTISHHIRQLEAHAEAVQEIERPFSWDLKRALTAPFRRYLFTTLIWLLVWLTAAFVEAVSDMINAPPLRGILFGPMVGWMGKMLAFSLLGCLSMSRLLVRADGKERLNFAEIKDYSFITEPVAFWFCAAVIGLVPITFYIFYTDIQIILVVLVTGNDYSQYLKPKPSFSRYFLIGLLSLWALVFYPMGLVVAALRRSMLPIFNPFAMTAAWVALKKWLTPAFVIVAALILVAGIITLIFSGRTLGLAVSTAAITLASLICIEIIGAAVHRGEQNLDLE